MPDSPSFPPAPFRTATRTVPADWIDYNGHMNVAYYTMAFDAALDEVYDALGIGPTAARDDRVGPMALQTQIHYLAELFEGSRFACDVLVVDMDAKRCHVFATMLDLDREERRAATYESLSLNVDLEARRSAPYSDAAYARIRALYEAQLTLPRPDEMGARLGIRHRPR